MSKHSHRSQQVMVNGEKSSVSTVSSGVPQGTVLAPLLFLCFINDIIPKIFLPLLNCMQMMC